MSLLANLSSVPSVKTSVYNRFLTSAQVSTVQSQAGIRAYWTKREANMIANLATQGVDYHKTLGLLPLWAEEEELLISNARLSLFKECSQQIPSF